MKTVLLFATTTGYQVRAFGDAAEGLGIRVVLATDRCKTLDDPWRDDAIPIRFDDERGSIRAVRKRLGERGCDGVLAVGDRPAALAAAVAHALGLPWHPPDAAAASRNKFLSRQRFRAAGLPVPSYRIVASEADAARLDVPFPCVVKPLVMSASRGVIRANDRAEFCEAFARVGRLLASQEVQALREPDTDRILVESYIPGDEYAVEGLLTEGRLQVLAVFDKPDPLEGPFFEETIYVTPSRAREEVQRAMERAVADACRALGLWHGPIHAECRITAGPSGERRGCPESSGLTAGAPLVHVLEVAARPIGGLCARALRFTSGSFDASLEALLLRHATGQPVGDWVREAAASGVMMVPIPTAGVFRRVEGVEEARAVAGIDDVIVTARPDQRLVPLPEGASYLGFVFARATTPEVAEAALRSAHGRLRFVIDRPLAVLPARAR